MEIAESGGELAVASRVTELLEEPSVLSALAMSRGIDPGIRCWALRGAQIAPSVATTLATRDPEPCAREAAVERLHDQRLLSGIAVSDRDEKVRAGALSRVEDIAFQMQRLTTDESGWVRWHAVRKVTNQTLLTLVARTDADADVRLEAIDRLQDRVLARRLLGEIAQAADEGSSMLVLSALGRGEMIDQAALVSIVRGPQNFIIRGVATGQIEDPTTLARIEQADAHEEVRAIARHQRESILLALQCDSRDAEACHTLATRARTWARDDDGILRWRAAVRCLRDPEVLAHVARSANVREREAAVENRHLVDQAVLAEIAAKDGEDLFVRVAAIRKLDDSVLLARLAASVELTLHWAASARLVAVSRGSESSTARHR